MANYYGSSFTYGGSIGDYGYVSGGSAQASGATYGSYSTGATQDHGYGPYGQKVSSGSAAGAYSGSAGSAAGYGVTGYSTYASGDSGSTSNYYKQGSGSSSSGYHASSGSTSGGGGGIYGRGRGSSSGGGSSWTPHKTETTSQSSSDAVVYSAAANMISHRTGGGGAHQRMSWKERFRVNGPPDPSQWKYCDLCKCSCAGPQAYKMHLEGKAHKKKEQMAGATSSTTSTSAKPSSKGHYFCPVCDVPCSSADAYAAHIRGAKHQKIVKLQQRMGKDIPDLDAAIQSTTVTRNQVVKIGPGGKKTVISAPKISFVGGTKLQSTDTGMREVASEPTTSSTSSTETSATLIGPVLPTSEIESAEDDVQPVGLEYIEESMNATNTAVQFYCKLCECSFTDAQAKNMHSKGRRHRLAYKKKVDPTLKVDLKPNMSAVHLNKSKRRPNAAEPWVRREIAKSYRAEAEALLYEREVLQYQLMKTLGGGTVGGVIDHHSTYAVGKELSIKEMRPNLSDERDLITKHNEIYPHDNEIAVIKSTMEDCEKALKLVSDYIHERDNPEPAAETEVKKEDEDKKPEETDKQEQDGEKAEGEEKAPEAPQPPPRALKGVMRVGPLAKTLLLHDQLDLDVVVMCHDKPTYQLLQDIYEQLPAKLEASSQNKYVVSMSPDGNRIILNRPAVEGANPDEPGTPGATCYISLTSPAFSPIAAGAQQAPEAAQAPAAPARAAPALKMTSGGPRAPTNQKHGRVKRDMNEILDEKLCINALAALRRVKWFQAKVGCYQAGPISVRIMMDFCRRVPTWNPINQWAIEQLVERALVSLLEQEEEQSPVKVLLKVFEIVATGVLLADGAGLRDPCEKESRDVLEEVDTQEREDITNSAQHALRMIAFGQLRRVLNLQIPTEMISQKDDEPPSTDEPSTAPETPTEEGSAPSQVPPAKRQKV